MKRSVMPSFVVTVAFASACGGSNPQPPGNPPAPEPPIATNPPAPDGGPGIGDGAGPPPATPDEAPTDDPE